MPAARRRVVAITLIGAALGALGLAACGGEEPVSRARLTATLVERAGLSDPQASCVAGRLFDDLDQAQIERVYRAGAIDELTPQEQRVVTGAAIACAT